MYLDSMVRGTLPTNTPNAFSPSVPPPGHGVRIARPPTTQNFSTSPESKVWKAVPGLY